MVMKNKKGQDLSIGTLILIVLGVIVLVLLILGFSLGWSNLWEKINIFGGSNSIGDVATACSLAVSSQNTYDFCQNFRQVKVDGKSQYVNCQDTRIATSISSGSLGCSAEYGDARTSAIRYCETLRTSQGTRFDDQTVVNGFTCAIEGVTEQVGPVANP